MSNCTDTARLSSDERLREVATILATGVVRLHQRVALPPEVTPKNLAELFAGGLEVPAETVLSVDNGVNGFRELFLEGETWT